VSKISTNNISGFPEFTSSVQIVMNNAISLIRNTFEQYGFVPLDTPAVERVSTLLSKGGSDHEIYGVHRLCDRLGDGLGDSLGVDNTKTDLALRFDLTVPLARYVSQNYGYIIFPYRRYHIAPVWRGERAQSGRYRQFYQCDIDIIGDNGELSLIHDAEVSAIAYRIFIKMQIGKFTIKINNRNLLLGLVKHVISDESVKCQDVIRIIDKISKITNDEFRSELNKIGASESAIEFLLEFINKKLDNDQWFEYLSGIDAGQQYRDGIQQIQDVMRYMKQFGVDERYFVVDPTLARGLDYYTGTIYEITLDDIPEIGSICGGGRYDNLVSSFSKHQLPGVGISIGLTRIIPKLIEMGILKADKESTADVIVTSQNKDLMEYYIMIANLLRESGIKTEMYLQNKNLSSQMKYANKKGVRIAIIADVAEQEADNVIVKNLITGDQEVINIAHMVRYVSNIVQI
jgi:histidyl-tRNA synthetase